MRSNYQRGEWLAPRRRALYGPARPMRRRSDAMLRDAVCILAAGALFGGALWLVVDAWAGVL